MFFRRRKAQASADECQEAIGTNYTIKQTDNGRACVVDAGGKAVTAALTVDKAEAVAEALNHADERIPDIDSLRFYAEAVRQAASHLNAAIVAARQAGVHTIVERHFVDHPDEYVVLPEITVECERTLGI